MTASTGHLKLVTHGLMGHDARVLLVREDGTEIDLSTWTRGVEVTIRVGEINQARVDLLIEEIDVEAEHEDVTSLVDRVRKYTAKQAR